MFIMARMLVPMNLQKVDQGVLPFLNYLCIDPADLIEIQGIYFADQAWGNVGKPGAICSILKDSMMI